MSGERQAVRWVRRAAVLLGFVGVGAGARAGRRAGWSPTAMLARVRR